MTTVNAALAAVNSGNAAAARGLYTPDAIVVDEFAPYTWRGAGAGHDWIAALGTMASSAHLTGIKGTMTSISEFDRSPSAAYFVAPTDVRSVMNGKTSVEHGVMTFALRRSGSKWLIVSQTWSTLSHS